MDEENTNVQNEQNEQNEQNQRTFTQEEVDAIINRRLAKERKGQPSAEELAAFREYQKEHAPKDDATKLKDMTSERDSAQTELEMARRENYLLRQGVSAEDVDFYVYKITKAMDEDESFEEAAKKYLKEHKARPGVRVDMGSRLNNGANGGKTNASQTMNDLIRKAMRGENN